MSRATDLEGLVAESPRLLDQPGRQVLAIAGAPGSGKSTTVEALHTRLEAVRPGESAVLPMDGFHYDDAVLRQMGRLPWKGAPDTFDVGGLRSALTRLRADDEDTVAVPVFDRDLEISRGSARLVPSTVRLILAEGNYLLLDRAPWSALHPLFDLTCMIDVSEDVLAERLRARWVGYGLDAEAIRHKLDGNDLPNGATVRGQSIPADLVFAMES